MGHLGPFRIVSKFNSTLNEETCKGLNIFSPYLIAKRGNDGQLNPEFGQNPDPISSFAGEKYHILASPTQLSQNTHQFHSPKATSTKSPLRHKNKLQPSGSRPLITTTKITLLKPNILMTNVTQFGLPLAIIKRVILESDINQHEVQGLVNVYFRERILSHSSFPVSKCVPSPLDGVNSSQVSNNETGRSRQRKQGNNAPITAVVGPQEPASPYERTRPSVIYSDNLPGTEQHKCAPTNRHSPDAQEDENMGKLGQGQGRKWAKESKSISLTSQRYMGLSRNKGGDVAMEDEGQ